MERNIQWVFDHSGATRGARFVLSYLAYIANDWGQVFKPVKDIAAELHLSRQAVTAAIKRLVALGDIVPMVKDGRSTVYRLACFNEAGEFTATDSDPDAVQCYSIGRASEAAEQQEEVV